VSAVAVATTASRLGVARSPGRAAGQPVILAFVVLVVLTAVPAVPGKLLLLDVACFAAFPLLLVTMVEDRRLGALVLLTTVWVIGQVLADMTNNGRPRLSLQLATAITVVTVTAALVRLSKGDPIRLRLFVAALACGLAAHEVMFAGPISSLGHMWKYGLALPVSVAVLSLCDIRWHAGARYPTLLALAALAAVDLFSDARSLAAFTLVTLGIYVTSPSRSPRLRVLAVVSTGVALGALVVMAFVAAARAGWLGERSSAQFEQASGGLYSVMLNARPELLQAWYLITQRPLTGYGSVPHLDTNTFINSFDYVVTHGVVAHNDIRGDWLNKSDPGVASHSMMLDAIVRAGLLALPFWLFVMVHTVRRMVPVVWLRASPLLAFLALVMLWDALFSPLSGLYHMQFAAYLALVLLPVPPLRGAS
jgi:hypothetical protein